MIFLPAEHYPTAKREMYPRHTDKEWKIFIQIVNLEETIWEARKVTYSLQNS